MKYRGWNPTQVFLGILIGHEIKIPINQICNLQPLFVFLVEGFRPKIRCGTPSFGRFGAWEISIFWAEKITVEIFLKKENGGNKFNSIQAKNVRKPCSRYLGVSKNNGTPKSSIFNRVFHHKPSILGYPYFWKHPFHVSVSVIQDVVMFGLSKW